MHIVPIYPEPAEEMALAVAKLDAAILVFVDDSWGLVPGEWLASDSGRWAFAGLLEAALTHLRRVA